jgi:plasmid maintenance system antidote protein VapI
MTSFVFDIGEKSRAVSRFIGHVRSELQRALAAEKAERRLTQQAIARAIGVNRSVINRQLIGYENLTLRSVAELAWALGWNPEFSLKKPEYESNKYSVTVDKPLESVVRTPTQTSGTSEYRYLVAA